MTTYQKDQETNDWINIGLLLLLYCLQGIPLGLAETLDVVLQERKLNFSEQGIFSTISWPYSLKILWAPIVDSLFIKRFGRRKSWLIPTQLIIGFWLLLLPRHLNQLLGNSNNNDRPQIYPLTGIFFLFYILAATQDIAVDGWAVELLSRDKASLASACNVIGQTAGFFIAFTGFLTLNIYNICDLHQFMFFWGVIFIISTLLVAFLKRELSEKELQVKLAASSNDQPDNIPESISEAYEKMLVISKLPAIKTLSLILLTRSIAFASTDSLVHRKLMEKGMKKEYIANLMMFITPLIIILPGIISKKISSKPLNLFKLAYPARIIMIFFSMLLLLYVPDFKKPTSLYFTFALFIFGIVQSILQTTMFVSTMGFFAEISDPIIGSTYMTLLNTLANLGSKWPNQFVLFLVNRLTWKHCDNKVDHQSCNTFDGFFTLSIACLFFGIIWYLHYRHKLDYLQNLPYTAWKLKSQSKFA